MAKRLTEEMVIARTKISDLSKIKRLNCWGTEISDVALLRKMPSVEVLSLSINKINSLEDFQLCKRLEELYIRQNDIRDINQVMYLQDLPNLKNLWLGENPCSNVEGYRLAVIKALPQLQKLDNVAVTQEELREAQRRGSNLAHPDYAQESEEEYEPAQTSKYPEYSESSYSPAQRSPPRQETETEIEESEDAYHIEEQSREENVRCFSVTPPQSPPRRTESGTSRSYSPEIQYIERRRNSYERESPRQPVQYYDKSASTNTSFDDNRTSDSTSGPSFKENKITSSHSASCIKEYTNGDRYVQAQPNHRKEEMSSGGSQAGDKRERYNCPAAAHRLPFGRRPVTRNSNILSAVLCLVKELDYPSLEVAEMAIRCRMDEIDE